MSSVQYLAGFHCPAADLSASKAQVISGRKTLYVTSGTKFVYIYDTEKKLTVAAFLFPAKVWQIELDSSAQQLYVLCAENGIFLLELDKEGRSVKEPGSSASAGRVNAISVGPESCCLCDPSICTIAVVHEVLMTVSKYLDKWGIKLYKRRSANDKPHTITPLREIELSFRPSLGDIKRMESAISQPVLCCVCLGKEKELSCNHVALEASLFTSLFGVDCTLLSTPIIFCGFPDGQVACFPLNAAGFSRPGNQEKPLVPVKVLYHIEQPVIFIGATKTEFPSGDPAHSAGSAEPLASDCLLLIGQGGLLVTITQLADTQGSTYEFREYHLQAPVSCAVSASSCIYYSTCSDLLSVTVPPAQKESASRTPRNPILPSASHNITRVVAVSQVSCTTQGDVELLALSNRGLLMLCKLCQRVKGAQVGVSRTNMGKRIKTLLSGIGTVSDRVSKLRTVLDQRTTSLLTLNQVMTVSRAVLTSPVAESPVRCEVKVSQINVLQQERFMASCILKNNTDCVLESGWILCLHLHSEDCDFSVSYNFPISRLLPGEITELCFPLSKGSCENLQFPIKVSCTLFYSFRNITTDCGNSDSNTAPFVPYKQGICLPLQELIIDFLHCIQLNPKAGLPVTPATSQMLSWDPVECFLLSSTRGKGSIKKLNHLPEDIGSLRVNYAAPLKARVRVSSLLVSQALQNEKPGVSVCCAVLRWLFPERWTGTENQEEVQGVTPDGKVLGLRVRKVSVGNLSETIPAFDIEITSPHLDALACLHMAVIRRLKTLVMQHKRNGGNIPELKLRNLQEQFIARESSLKEVQALRDRLCVQKELSLDTILHRLLDTYRVLRDPGLAFL